MRGDLGAAGKAGIEGGAGVRPTATARAGDFGQMPGVGLWGLRVVGVHASTSGFAAGRT